MVICDPALEGLMVSVRALLLRKISCLLLLLTDVPLHAAFEFQPASARAGGVGDNFVAWAQSPKAVFWNPGAIVWNSGIGVIGGYDRPFGVSELRSGILGMVIPIGKVVAGIRIEDFGFALCREQVMGATLEYRVADRLGAGLAIRSLRLKVEGSDSANWTVFDLGVKIVLPERVRGGVSSWNACGNRTRLLGQGGMLGIGFEVSPDVSLVADIRKESGLPTGGGVGLEFVIGKSAMLRLGAGNQPERFSGGFGVRKGTITVDYSAAFHSIPGISQRVPVKIGK